MFISEVWTCSPCLASDLCFFLFTMLYAAQLSIYGGLKKTQGESLSENILQSHIRSLFCKVYSHNFGVRNDFVFEEYVIQTNV